MIRMSSGDTGCTAWCTLKTVAGSSPHPPERLPAMTFPHRDPCSRHATSGSAYLSAIGAHPPLRRVRPSVGSQPSSRFSFFLRPP
jgi:hypothetical protein